ncbi:MAG: hypothetical protein ABI442_09025 [Gemmatimonadaceae bacterium]
MLRRSLPIAIAVAAAAPQLHAQSIMDIGARIAPQFHQYNIDGPTNTKISEFSLPMFVVVPITSSFGFDIGSSFAQSKVQQTIGGKTFESNISGLTDTQIRANLSIGTDFIVITGGVNLPTGTSTVPLDKQTAASLIGSDFLAFPISNMGSGFGGTGGIALAQALGDWNLGIGLSARKSVQYDPFDAVGGLTLHYQPGNEYRGRVGLDHALGTGHFTVGVTYSTFGDDNYAGSIYNTGNRIISQIGISDMMGVGTVSLNGWDVHRTSGTVADGTKLGSDNIGNGALGYTIPMGDITVEPNVEGRFWVQSGASTSGMGTVGLRLNMTVAGFSILPSGGYSFGQIAAQDATGANTTLTLTGFHATLTIRLR